MRKRKPICMGFDIPWKSKTKERMVFRMIHIKDSLLPMGKVWSLDSLGIYIYIHIMYIYIYALPESKYLKIDHPKRKLVFQPSIFRCYVSFREGI